MNCLYTIPLCNFGFAFRHATCVIVKDFGKALLQTKSYPIFFSYKLSERKPLFEIVQYVAWWSTCLYASHWVSSFLSLFASLNHKAFDNLFCNSQKSFHTSPRSADTNNRGYRPFIKLNNGICNYKKMALLGLKNDRLPLLFEDPGEV